MITIPFIGYASMALRSTEGLIIVGLAVVFVIILFILAEIWKKDEDDDEEDEYGREDNGEEDEAPAMSRRSPAARRKRRRSVRRRKPAQPKSGEEDEEDEEDDIRIAEPVKKKDRQQPAKENRKETETLAHPGDLFAETESSMASAIADMMEQDQQTRLRILKWKKRSGSPPCRCEPKRSC